MDFWTTRSERLTAILSTVMAIAILAGGVTAFQSHHAPVDDVVQLESDFRFQLEVGFRHDVNERARRLEQLEKVSQVWQQSPRSEADRQELAKWLLEATIRSMPGSIEALPDSSSSFGEQPQLPVVDRVVDRTADIHVEPMTVPEHVEMTPEPLIAEPLTLKSGALVPTPVAYPQSFASAERAPIAEPTAISFELLTTPLPLATHSPIAASQVRINLSELTARIAGYHEGLNEIETALLSLDAGDFAALTKKIDQLEDIASDFLFAKLYYEALTDRERLAVVEPRPMTAAFAVVGRRIDQTQVALSGDYLGEFDSRNQSRIGELRQQLAELTATTK